jgi:MFS transporter, DHA2 family, multidrug resistance protein
VLWRSLQVMGLAFVFIPISTLNYVGVPRDKNNQISSFSNFARNLGGSVGTAMLTTFLQRTQQTHQQVLSANVISGSVAYSGFIDATKAALMKLGHSSDAASQMAIGQAYQVMLRQSSMLSYQNAFWCMSMIVACLIPLPFIMRKPPKMDSARKPAAEH